MKTHHRGRDWTKRGAKTVHAIVLWKERELRQYRVRVAQDTLAVQPPMAITISYDEAPHLQESGISMLIKSWGTFNIGEVLNLIVMPSEYKPAGNELVVGSLAKKTEAFLSSFHRAVGFYLRAAQHIIQKQHSIFRNALNDFDSEG
jgi:hypothetical protein